ncbi:putative penicillin-binding protein 2 [uncultured Eubacteriales bacterium]|uniref:Putative penicillin-binding protein 2 n=1 Tax=uncultured Eubacteriales bacterium TaxID=172733 RepID=A0A212KHV9_9FIRM|nr:putative penicillin-binding protein 2 [uncultured Eubacteriales bacterium]
MDARQFHGRVRLIILALGGLLLSFVLVLYNLQVVNGAEYLSQSERKISNTETVEAARGEILDRYGRVLVSNRTSYQVTLDAGLMGAEESRNPNLLSLITLCRSHGVSWTDTLPISVTEPFTSTLDTLSETGQTRYKTFLDKMKWTDAAAQGPDALITAMRKFYKVDESVSAEDGRALVGVLCELRMRTLDILRTNYVFASDVDMDFISAVKENGLVGVSIKPVSVRQYNTPYAAHLLGHVGLMTAEEWAEYQEKGYSMNDTVGKDGVELAFEDYLRGTPGVRAIDLNTSGKVVSETWLTEPDPGNNLSLTLDIRLQETVERSLAERIPALPSEYTQGGSAVVMDVKSGDILAMASWPTFDLSTVYQDSATYNAALSDPLKPFYNRAAQGTYSPGSAFKMVVGTAALQEGLTTPGEKILDTGRFQYPAGQKYPYGDYHPACWIYLQYGGTHGREDMAHALKDSCNIYFYTLGDRLGIDKIDQYADMFGLGKSTGFELNEAVGQVAGPETSAKLETPWYGGDLLSAAIGQGNTLTTPLQLANYVATLVNGGNHYSAHVLQSVKSGDFSSLVYQQEPELMDTLNISSDNMETVKAGMKLLATEGSVKNYFKDLPVTVGAKTGTAQVGREDTNANAVFVCFAPYENPEIAISIVVERGGSGTELAAIAADIMSYYFNAEQALGAVEGENTLLR